MSDGDNYTATYGDTSVDTSPLLGETCWNSGSGIVSDDTLSESQRVAIKTMKAARAIDMLAEYIENEADFDMDEAVSGNVSHVNVDDMIVLHALSLLGDPLERLDDVVGDGGSDADNDGETQDDSDSIETIQI